MTQKRTTLGVEQLEGRDMMASTILDGVTIDYPDDLQAPATQVRQQIDDTHIDVRAAASQVIQPTVPSWTALENADKGGGVHGVAFSPDGTKMLTYGQVDVLIRDVATGGILVDLNVHPNQIAAAAFSPDGTKVVTTSYDRTAKISDASSGQMLATLDLPHIGNGVQFFNDGVRVAVGTQDNAIRLWNTQTGAVQLIGGSGYIKLGEVREDLDLMIYTRNDSLVARTLSTGVERSYTGMYFDANASAISTDGSLVAAGDVYQGWTAVWNRSTGQRIGIIPSIGGTIVDMEFLPGNILAISGAFQRLQLWDLSTGTPAMLQEYGIPGPEQFRMVPGTDKLATSSATQVRILDMPAVAGQRRLQSDPALQALASAEAAFEDAMDEWVPNGINVDGLKQVSTASLRAWMDSFIVAPPQPLTDEEALEAALAQLNLSQDDLGGLQSLLAGDGEGEIVDSLIAALSAAPVQESPSLSTGAIVGDNSVKRLLLALEELGGSADIASWKGSRINAAALERVSAAWANALQAALAQAAPTPLTQAQGWTETTFDGTTLHEERTTTVAGFGAVKFRASDHDGYRGFLDVKQASLTVQGGTSRIQATFLEGAKYVGFVDVKLLSGTANGYLQCTREDGSVLFVEIGTSERLFLGERFSQIIVSSRSGSTYGLVGISGGSAQEQNDIASGDKNVLIGNGSGMSIDLSSTEHLVTSVSAHVLADRATNVTAYFYSGSTEIGSQSVQQSGDISLEHEEGITSIVLVSADKNARLGLTELDVVGDTEQSQVEASTITPLNQRMFGVINAPRWESGAAYNYITVGQNNGVVFRSYINGTPNFTAGTLLFVDGGSPVDQYQVITLTNSGANLGIFVPFYINQSGVHNVPNEYWTRLSDQSILLMPGAPKYIAVRLNGSGMGNANISRTISPELANVMPAQGMDVRVDLLDTAVTQPEQGFRNVPSEIASHARPVMGPGGSMNVTLHLKNNGLGGGQIVVRSYVGYTPGQDALGDLQQTFTTTMSGSSEIALSANISAPQAPAGMSNPSPIAKFVVTMPDGSTEFFQIVGQLPTEAAGYSPDNPPRDLDPSEQRRMDTLYRRISNVFSTSSDARIAGLRTQGVGERLALLLTAAEQDKGDELSEEEVAAIVDPELEARLKELRVSQLTYQLEGILDDLAGTNETIANAIQKLREDDPELEKHLAEELVAYRNSSQVVSSDDLRSFIMSRLSSQLITLSNSEPSEVLQYSYSETEITASTWASIREAARIQGSAHSMSLLLGLYNTEGIGTLEIGGKKVRIDTQAGEIFAGLWSQLRLSLLRDRAQFMEICVAAEDVLGISATQLAGLARATEFQRFRDGLFKIFFDAGYDITKEQAGRNLPSSVEYRGDSLRIHFNPSGVTSINHVWINIMHPEIDIVMQSNISIPSEPGKLYVDVPFSTIQGTTQGRLKIIAWPDSGNDSDTLYKILNIDWQKFSYMNGTPNTGLGTISRVGTDEIAQRYAANYDQLNEADKNRIKEALSFTLDDDPESKNHQIIDWLLANYLENGEMTFIPENDMWIGKAYNNMVLNEQGETYRHKHIGQCKWWVDNIVIAESTGIDVPANVPNLVEGDDQITRDLSYKWQETTLAEKIVFSDQGGDLNWSIRNSDRTVLSGDIIQLAMGNYPHTVIIGAITEAGIWVFDSNFGEDVTPRYHFISNESLENYSQFTIYRIN